MTATSLELPKAAGKLAGTYANGRKCGSKPGVVQLLIWSPPSWQSPFVGCRVERDQLRPGRSVHAGVPAEGRGRAEADGREDRGGVLQGGDHADDRQGRDHHHDHQAGRHHHDHQAGREHDDEHDGRDRHDDEHHGREQHDDHRWLMDAVVLVGGEGTRLRPLTYEIPKQMLPVVERPMIVHVLEWLAQHGVDRAVLSLGYRADAFLQAFPTSKIAGVALEYVVEPEPLDTAGAIRFAAEKAGVSDTFLVLNGDVLTDFDARPLRLPPLAPGGSAPSPSRRWRIPRAFGVVPTDEDGRVTAFIEKPPPGEAPTNLINAGIYVLETSVLERIPAGRRVSIERETFPELVEGGILYALASDAYWLDTGTPEQFLQAQLDILSGAGACSCPRRPRSAAGSGWTRARGRRPARPALLRRPAGRDRRQVRRVRQRRRVLARASARAPSCNVPC